LIPSIAEEPGWRGFALPRLQQRYGPIGASLILGLLHGLWHMPALMTINLGPLPLANYVPFMLTVIMTAVLYTWVYNHTAGSVLIAMLMHAAGNAVTQWLTVLFRDAGLQEPRIGVAGFLASTTWINVIGYGLAALLLVVLTRGRLGARTPPPANSELHHAR
jgi:membrane protease YdiL (CAAX protease family)